MYKKSEVVVLEGEEKRIFVIAPFELLKTFVVVDLLSFIEHIRSLSFLRANSSKVPSLLTS